MTPAEHRANAERLMSAASFYTADPAKDPESRSLVMEASLLTAQAQVHATLALAPAPPPPAQPQHKWSLDKWSLDKPHEFPDATGLTVRVQPTSDRTGVVLAIEDIAVLMENPDVLRTLASLLTAHADRMEPKP